MAPIRFATEDDAAAIHEIYAPFCGDSIVSFEVAPPGIDEMRRRIRETSKAYPWIVCAEGPRLLGYVYASRYRERAAYRWSVDVTAYMHPDARGKGLGRRLYTALFKLLAPMGYHRAYAGITLPNDASVGLHKAMGFGLVGVYKAVGFKCGAWRDVSWWEKPVREGIGAPDEPLAMGDFAGTEVCRDILRTA